VKGNHDMNSKTHHLKIVAAAFALLLLTGCLYPHTTIRSSETDGRILDARTHAAVRGAKVFLTENPKVSCTSDATGHFRLRETHYFHLMVGPGEGGGWPRAGDPWGCALTISKAGYLTYVQHGPDDWRLSHKGDIFLEPNQ